MLAPMLHGRILQATGPGAADAVLEVGTGTGYLTACFGLLAKSTHSIDIRAEFTAAAAANLRAVPGARVQLETRDAFGSAPLGRVRRHCPDRLAAGVRRPLRAGACASAAGCSPSSAWRRSWTRSWCAASTPANGFARACSRPVIDPLVNATGAAGVRILMVEEITPQEFLERRAAGRRHGLCWTCARTGRLQTGARSGGAWSTSRWDRSRTAWPNWTRGWKPW